MKKSILLGLLGFSIIFVFVLCIPQKNDVPLSNTRELYNNNCASCHGIQLERFAGRNWVFGGSKNEIASTIKNGRPSIGMPAFAKAMSDAEILNMAEFIITELPERSKFPDNSSAYDTMTFRSGSLSFKLSEMIGGLSIPWGMTFLPDGSMLVTDKSGSLFKVHYNVKTKIEGVPKVMFQGQGGLLDVALHPNFKENNFIYIAYADKVSSEGGNTSIMRAKLIDNKLVDTKRIFHAQPNSFSGVHFGCRIVFDNDGYLFFSVGERGTKTNAQDLTNQSGKIHRLRDDGSIPSDNPFLDKHNNPTSIWSYGHRNPQSLYYEKETGILWENEHGPKGGDELNIIEKGKNYGWPVITFGIDYDGSIISPDTAKPGMQQPIYYWIPSIGPSGMTRVKGNLYKGWEDSFLCGSLSFKYLERVEVKNNKVVFREKLLQNIGRVRNVVQAPDGFIYISVEDPGRVYKIVPL